MLRTGFEIISDIKMHQYQIRRILEPNSFEYGEIFVRLKAGDTKIDDFCAGHDFLKRLLSSSHKSIIVGNPGSPGERVA